MPNAPARTAAAFSDPSPGRNSTRLLVVDAAAFFPSLVWDGGGYVLARSEGPEPHRVRLRGVARR